VALEEVEMGILNKSAEAEETTVMLLAAASNVWSVIPIPARKR
jgi:hypothetical protein